jgi:hypothetical protein
VHNVDGEAWWLLGRAGRGGCLCSLVAVRCAGGVELVVEYNAKEVAVVAAE